MRAEDPHDPRSPVIADRPIVVVGLMGAGKTTVATALAAELGRHLRDSDADIAAVHGVTAAELAARHGRAALHEVEAAHLDEALGGGACVVAAAASVIDRPDLRIRLRQDAVTVWLTAAPEVLAARVAAGGHRPFEDTPVRDLTAQSAARDALFGEVADLVVDASAAPEVVVADAMEGLRALGRSPGL